MLVGIESAKFINEFFLTYLMDVVYSHHAKKRLKQRGIEEWEVEHLIKYPSYTKKTFDGKIEAVGEIKNRETKIVYVKKENYIKIVTMI